MRSMAVAPSLSAYRFASLVKPPVVTKRPLSERPTTAPLKSRISEGPTDPRISYIEGERETKLDLRVTRPHRQCLHLLIDR